MAEANIPPNANHDAAYPRWWSRALQVGAVMAIIMLLIGPLGTKFGIWPFNIGLMLMAGAAVLAAIGFIGGLWGYMIARSKGYAPDKPLCGLAALLSAVVLGVFGSQFLTATSVPPIHNISTDLTNPPEFSAIVALREAGTNPLEYDAEKLAPLQSEAYPDVTSLTTDLDRSASLARAASVLEDMGLEIVAADPEGQIVEATYTSFWFGFKDDVVVRVQPAGAGSEIDVRSVSRVGQSDLGANAKRITEFLTRFQQG